MDSPTAYRDSSSQDSSFIYPVQADSAMHNFVPVVRIPVVANKSADRPLVFERREQIGNDAFFFIFLAVAAVWIMLFHSNRKPFLEILRSFVNNVSLAAQMRDHVIMNSALGIILTITGILMTGMFYFTLISRAPDIFGLTLNFPVEVDTMIPVLFALSGLFLLKVIVQVLSGILFEADDAMKMYLGINFVTIQVLGLALFPVLLAMYFTHIPHDVLAWLGLAVIGITFIYRLIRVFVVANIQTDISLMHIILYLCALEILPLLIIGKWLLGTSL